MIYAAIADWANDGESLAFLSTSRDHKRATLRVADDLQTSQPPTTEELTVLRDLQQRTRQAATNGGTT